MARAESRPQGLRQEGTDDVEKSLELLDKVLSEFEEPDSLPPVEPESPSQGHQSEDDGYMSMNGRRAKFAPEFQPTDETPLMAPQPPLPVPPDEKSPPPAPEEAQRIISNLLPRVSPSNTANTSMININRKTSINIDHRNWSANPAICRIIPYGEDDGVPAQTTLPKARPTCVMPSKYGTLPSSSPPRAMGPSDGPCSGIGSGGLRMDGNGGSRTILGIGISAVHDAVLRGIARIPEPIVNEHPVTIYPGRASPPRRVPPRTLPGSIERHREVCRKNSPNQSSSQESSDENQQFIIISNSPSSQLLQQQELLSKSPPLSIITHQKNLNNLNRTKSRHHHNPCNGGAETSVSKISDSDDFSDDSLEDTSLPPPPPPPVIPPCPSLSAPVTPSKRGSIAWEINLDDPSTLEDPLKMQGPGNIKVIGRRRGRSVSGSQSSLASTPGHSAASNKQTGSCEWPDPPEPPICSTEDEAASLYSDSDELIPYPSNLIGQGTYIIRKGRKQRQRVPIMDSMSSINSRLSNEGNLGLPSPIFPASLIIPNSRHSIDLGSPQSPPLPVQNSLNSPRSRLSLDLSSLTSELPATTSSTIISPRYTEFKTYSSTFDGLQALENNNNGTNNNINNNNNLNDTGLPLMRVASLPAITPPPPLSGDVLSTPRRELAPPIEEDEEQDSESQRGAPLRQIENNISALLRGDIAVARVGDIPPLRRPLGFRPGVHKSESAKEMLLSQSNFGPLPPSPPTSSPEMENDGFPPLPPSPRHKEPEKYSEILHGIQNIRVSSRNRIKSDNYCRENSDAPPAIPPHRGPSLNTLKTRSMDAGFSKSYRNGPFTSISPHGPGTLPPELPGGGASSRRRLMSGAFPKRSAQSPREERRLQTSCSLPETPIFARGCDIPRTPHRRAPDLPGNGGSRTAPRTSSTTLNSSIVGITGSATGNRQRSVNHALASAEMLRLAGGPARGWYPKQRHPRPASTENLDRLQPQGSIRAAWDAGTGSRKPLTLPPNLTPKFFNKSPREALRRVTSLLIRKGNGSKDKESKQRDKDKEIPFASAAVHRSPGSLGDDRHGTTHKKKGFLKSFWKKSKHYSLEQ